jgi:hypothetical protein
LCNAGESFRAACSKVGEWLSNRERFPSWILLARTNVDGVVGKVSLTEQLLDDIE